VRGKRMAGWVKPTRVEIFFIPIATRMPLKFGKETLRSVTCVRVRMWVVDERGVATDGWGETPLSVQWAWPSSKAYEGRQRDMMEFCKHLAEEWIGLDIWGDAMELGHTFNTYLLPLVLKRFNLQKRSCEEDMPWLAALVCNSAFDIALHDAYAKSLGLPVYETYVKGLMKNDLSHYLEPVEGSGISFEGKYICDFILFPPKMRLPVWHLVGGEDPVDREELRGDEPEDGYPVLLEDWIRRDGIRCLKIKLRGNDMDWDYNRIVRVGEMGIENGVLWFSVDFNCTVEEQGYVVEILDRLLYEHPEIYARILYVEQPFPYDLEKYRFDVRPISSRKPIFMDESAHDWRMVRLGRELGWSGVALKTCKTQTGALLSMCWAKAHGMTLMVQDLTNPMLAQIPHVLLAAYSGTIMGVESNAMQFYPDASGPEAAVHPGVYRRVDGILDLSTIKGPGFGYRIEEIRRPLPDPSFVAGEV
jgi:L-alanine-DL-glutamate epimerase-like enolase superfamily enzyme